MAQQRAARFAPFIRLAVLPQVSSGVFDDGLPQAAALRRTEPYQAVLIHVQEPGSRPAMPLRALSLEEPGAVGALEIGERLRRRIVVVPQVQVLGARDADTPIGGVQQVDREQESQVVDLADHLAQLVPGLLAQHEVDVHVEGGEAPQDAELGSQRLEALLDVACAIGPKRIDAHFHVGESGGVQPVHQVLGDEKAVGGHGHLRVLIAVRHDLGQLGVHQRLPAQERHVDDMQPVQRVDPLREHGEGDHPRDLVVLGAVAAAQVAAPRDDQLRLDRRPPEQEIDGRTERMLHPHVRLVRAVCRARE